MNRNHRNKDTSMWEHIRVLDKSSKSSIGNMVMFIIMGIYFIIALCGDYREPVYMAVIASAVTMGSMIPYLLSFIIYERACWTTVYRKIMYFPVDRKKYLLAKLIHAMKLTGVQVGIVWLLFLCRYVMNQKISLAVMILITVCIVISGIWYAASMLGLMAAGERAKTLFVVPFVAGLWLTKVICQIVMGLLPGYF